MKKRIIVFGVGFRYEQNKEIIKKNYEIVAYADNNPREFCDGIAVNLKEALTREYDLIIITPDNNTEMYKQCLNENIAKEKVLILELVPVFYQRNSLGIRCYGQHFDDLFLAGIFGLMGIDKPTYLDLGANHPYYISNTALFYENGCRGVNVDANADTIDLFNFARPDDINLNLGVGDSEGELPFYSFSSTCGLNTFSKVEAENAIQKFGVSLEKIKKVRVVTLQSIIDDFCEGVFPDFLDCDIEGYDYAVLSSFDFNKTGPKVICVEVRKDDIDDFNQLLNSKGYFFLCRISENNFYVRECYRKVFRIYY